MSTGDSEGPARLARHVIARRHELDLSQLDVWHAGGPSNTTLTEIENGRLKTLTRTVARKIETGLQWEAGSSRRVWTGGDPVTAQRHGTDPTPLIQNNHQPGFGDRLQAARKRAGFRTQQALGDVLGRSARTIRNWETDTTLPDVADLAELRQVLGDLEPMGDPVEQAIRASRLTEDRQYLVLAAYKRELRLQAEEGRAPLAAHSRGATIGEEGRRVRERRERLGVDKKALAEQAGVNRNTLADIEAGESFNRTTLAKIERALDALEEQAGIDAGPTAPADYYLTDPTPGECGGGAPFLSVRGAPPLLPTHKAQGGPA